MQAISSKDRARLRQLAARQAEVAHSPGMAALYEDWRRHGAFVPDARPMVTIELWTFADEILPGMLACEGADARRIEAALLSAVIPYTLFGDDTPVRPYFPVKLHKDFVPYGLPMVKTVAGEDKSYVGAGFAYHHYIEDLAEDFHKLGPSQFWVDAAATQKEIDDYNEIFGDVLPARRMGENVAPYPASALLERMGMENLYVALLDEPELVLKAIHMLAEDYHRYLDLLEGEGLLLPTCGDEELLQGSYCFTDALPCEGAGLTTRQVWGASSAEEFNDVSAEMYKTFVVEPLMSLAGRMGALSYGCCEAVHRFWENSIETLPGLRKVSISAWCDEAYMGQRLRGRNIVFHHKPTVNLLGVSPGLDEDATRAYFRATAEAASGCRLEVSQRDIYLLHGNVDKVARYIQLIRETLARHWQP